MGRNLPNCVSPWSLIINELELLRSSHSALKLSITSCPISLLQSGSNLPLTVLPTMVPPNPCTPHVPVEHQNFSTSEPLLLMPPSNVLRKLPRQSYLQGGPSCTVTLGLALRRAPCLVQGPAVTVLQFIVIFEQGALHFILH